MVEVELAGCGLLKKLAATMAQELVETNLDLEGLVGILLVQGLLVVFDERNLLVGSFGREDVAE